MPRVTQRCRLIYLLEYITIYQAGIARQPKQPAVDQWNQELQGLTSLQCSRRLITNLELQQSAMSRPCQLRGHGQCLPRGFVSQRINIHPAVCARLQWNEASQDGSSLLPDLQGHLPKV